MKKIIAFVCLFMLNTLVFAAENSTSISAPNFKITKHWKLSPTDSFAYYIENPMHSELNLAFEISPTTLNQKDEPVPSSAIKLTCGDQIFYVSEYSPTGMTLCKTKGEIHFELVSLQGNPSEGKFVLQQ